MFISALDKTIFINRSSEPETKACKFITYSYIEDYNDLKASFPTTELLYKDLLSKKNQYNTYNNYHVFILKNNDFIDMLLDYCSLLRLDNKALDKIIEYSRICEIYEENHYNFISVYDEDFIIDADKYNIKRSIITIKDPSIFPVEFFINCLDNDIAIKKFSRMRIYELYNTIKDLQYYLIRQEISIPDELIDFTYNDKSALALNNPEKFSDVIEILDSYNINIDKFTCSIDKYLDMDPNFYDRYFMTKYNYLLARYLKSINYRIV